MRNKVIIASAILWMAANGVCAQSLTLHSGDHVSVDSTGTHGIINGHRVNNKITSYTSIGSVRGVDNDAIKINGTATFTLGSGGTITGGPNGIALEVLDSGKVNISGGTISCKQPSAPVNGSGTALSAGGTGLIKITGGTITGVGYGAALDAEEGGAIIVSNGTITGGQYGPALAPEGSSTITLIGGTITTEHGVLGLSTGGSNGTINLYSRGKPFIVNGIAMNNTSLAANSSGTISGTLADGQLLDTTFINGGHIRLNIGKPPTLSPEP